MRNPLMLSLLLLGCAGQTELDGYDDGPDAQGGANAEVSTTVTHAAGGATSIQTVTTGGATSGHTLTVGGSSAVRSQSTAEELGGGPTSSTVASTTLALQTPQTCRWIYKGVDKGPCGNQDGTRVCDKNGDCVPNIEDNKLDCDRDGVFEAERSRDRCSGCSVSCRSVSIYCYPESWSLDSSAPLRDVQAKVYRCYDQRIP